MTENTATETPQTTPETDEKAPVTLDRSTLSPMAAMILDQLSSKFDRAVAIANEQNKTGDLGQLLSEAVENSEDPEVVKLRKFVNDANEKILKAQKTMEEKVKPTLNLPSEEEIAKLEEEYKALANELNTYNSVFTTETKNSGEEHSVYDFLGQLPGKKRGAKAGQGTGTSRPRVKAIEITTDVKGEDGWKKVETKDGKSTFGVLANFIKSATNGGVDLGAGDFHDAWVKQNGGKEWKDLADVSTFSLSATGEDEKSYRWMVRVTK